MTDPKALDEAVRRAINPKVMVRYFTDDTANGVWLNKKDPAQRMTDWCFQPFEENFKSTCHADRIRAEYRRIMAEADSRGC